MSRLLPDVNELQRRIAELEAENKNLSEQLIKDKQDLESSETQFRVLLDYAPEPMYIQFDDNRFTYLNLAACNLYGVTNPEELTGTSVFDRIDPEIHQIVKDRISKLKENNEPIRGVKSKQIRIDGTMVHVEVSAVRIKYENQPACLVILKDIDERVKAEGSLRHSHDLMRYIIEHSRSAIAVHDRDLKYIYVSQRYLKEYNVKDQNIIGKHHYEVFPDLPEKWKIVHQKALKGEICSEDNDIYFKEDGSFEWTRWECRPWFESDGSIGGIIVYTEVITDRVKMEEELRKTNERLLKEKQKAEQAELELKESYELLKNLADQVPGVIYQYRLYPDGSSRFPWSSSGMWDIYECTPDEVREDASKVFTRLHAEDYQMVSDAIFESAKNQSIFHVEFRVILPEQGLRWRSSTAKPRLLEDGSTLWYGVITDITVRREIEQELEQKNEEINNFFDLALDLLCIADTDGYFLRLNREWENVLGYPLTELEHSRFLDLVHPEDLEATLNVLQKLSNQENPKAFVNRYKCYNGEYKWIEWKSIPSGNVVYAAARDITERIRIETELKVSEMKIKKLNEELEERIALRTRELLNANKELEAFSYSVSHDLRSPLRAVIGYTNILLEDYDHLFDEEGKRICSVISSNAVKMGKLIDDLLSFSRLSRNEMQYSGFDMKELVSLVFSELMIHHPDKTVEIEIADLPKASGDFSMIKQVWTNLISNAIKYTSQREKALIKIGFTENLSEIIYYISDNGIGFDMQYVSKLFGVFQRLHNTRDFEGTGVGLAIVHRVINRHGGRVWAEGKLDSGATFYIALPKTIINEE